MVVKVQLFKGGEMSYRAFITLVMLILLVGVIVLFIRADTGAYKKSVIESEEKASCEDLIKDMGELYR